MNAGGGAVGSGHRRLQAVARVQRPATTAVRPWTVHAGGVVLLGLLCFTLLFRLGQYPSPWYDEGAFLKVSKNLAVNGVYADYSSEGNRYLGPIFSTGPIVLVPIAGLFKLVGVNIVAARAVMVGFTSLMLLALFLLASRVYSRTTAIVAVTLVAFSTSVNLGFYGRVVGGEVPAIVFLLAALTLWLAPGAPRPGRLVVVGLLFGVACSTKFQFAAFILPALLLAWMSDLVWYRQRRWPFFVVPGAVAGLVTFGWLYVVIATLSGPGAIGENWQAFRGTGGNALQFDPQQLKQALAFLSQFGLYGALFFVGLGYGVLVSLGRSRPHEDRGILALLALGGTGVYVLGIADWTRYALPAAVLVSMFVADFLHALLSGAHAGDRPLLSLLTEQEPRAARAARWFAGVVLFAAIGLGAVVQANRARKQGDYQSAYAVAQYLQQNVPGDALIETWEKELSLLTEHAYHYPPMAAENALVSRKWRGGEPRAGRYDFGDYVRPDYVVRGPYAKWAGAYEAAQLIGFDLVTSIGPYDVYRRTF